MTVPSPRPHETLYESQAALRMVDRAIDELTGEIALDAEDPRYAHLVYVARRLSERCARLDETISALGATRARVTIGTMADATDTIATVDACLARLTAELELAPRPPVAARHG